jgi:hypothetical protein
VVHRAEGADHRLLSDLFGGDHHRKAANTKSLDSLPLGESTFTQAIAYWRKLLITINTKITQMSDLVV